MPRIVTNQRGESFELTRDEETFLAAIERLHKIRRKRGRLQLFGNGSLDVRFGGDSV